MALRLDHLFYHSVLETLEPGNQMIKSQEIVFWGLKNQIVMTEFKITHYLFV